jgi:hypothetical protein
MLVALYRRFGAAYQLYYPRSSSPKIRENTSIKQRRKPEISHVYCAAQKGLMFYSRIKVAWKGDGIYEVVWREREKRSCMVNVGSMENIMKSRMAFMSKRGIR